MGFCINCGAPLEDDSRFCVNCGTPVESQGSSSMDNMTVQLPLVGDGETQQQQSQAAAQYQPQSQYGQYQQQGANQTQIWQQMPAQEIAVGGAGAEQKSANSALVGILAFAITIIVVALLYFFLLAPSFGLPVPEFISNITGGNQTSSAHTSSSGGSTTSSSSTSTTTSSQTSTQSTSSTARTTTTSTSATSTTSEADEETIHSSLDSFYNQMTSFNDEVKSCASTFNSVYAKSDTSSRSSLRTTLADLLSRIDAQRDNLSKVSVPSSSKYAGTYEALKTCYTDLYYRTNVLIECLDISLKYSNPESHTSEIKAPLTRDLGTDGKNNKYYLEYNENCDKANPANA